MATKRPKPTVEEIITLRWNLDPIWQLLHNQQLDDDIYYNQGFTVSGTPMPANFEQIRPDTAKMIIDMATNNTSGNYPRIHAPRTHESEAAQINSTLREKAASGFWYRTVQNEAENPIRSWAKHLFLRGAAVGALLYDQDLWAELPMRTDFGTDAEFKDASDEAIAERKSQWPFHTLVLDPITCFPDPSSDGRNYFIVSVQRYAYDLKYQFPEWDYFIPGNDTPCRPNDWVQFITYFDPVWKAYLIGNAAVSPGTGTAVNAPRGVGAKLLRPGIVKHGYGFLPYKWVGAGLGQPTGLPHQRFKGLITQSKDLLRAEARRMSHMDALIAEYAFPHVAAQRGVDLHMELGGVTWVPQGTKPADAVEFKRPTVPLQEVLAELSTIREAITRQTVPDPLGGIRPVGVESGYHESILLGTGRMKLKSSIDSLERMIEWTTAGFFKLVENKIKGKISVWGKGFKETEFISIGPDDIKGAYEIYAYIAPALPQDEAATLHSGITLFEHGLTSGRDVLETYAGRENAEELLTERMVEDIAKSGPVQTQMVQDVLKSFGPAQATTGPIGAPGFATGQLPLTAPAAPVGNTATPAGVPQPPPETAQFPQRPA